MLLHLPRQNGDNNKISLIGSLGRLNEIIYTKFIVSVKMLDIIVCVM
jgi:hypothetical protein